MFRASSWALACSLGFLAAGHSSLLAEPKVDAEKFQQVVSRGINYLVTAQNEDGSYSKFAGIGPTALATTALLRHGRSPDDPVVARGLKFIEQHVQENGGIYPEASPYRNYETCIAILCLTEANADGRYDATIKRADAFVRGIQWGPEQGIDEDDFAYGGAGYGRKNRPDLSNTQFLIEALRAAGAGPDDPAIQRALVFVSRSQNLESEHNTTPFATKNPDGGFYYTPAAGGESMAGETETGGLRSYASMTYAGLKSMIYAGVGPEDQRVKAAVEWIQRHYGLEDNPGLGAAGLYYYYHTFAKALDALGEDIFVDSKGVKHNWRAELLDELARRQQENGSWVNEASDRWLEGDANLVTAYALLSLSYCKP